MSAASARHVRSAPAAVPRSGWMTFSGLMLILAGSFTIVHALAAIQRSNYLSDHVLFSSLRGWGWFFLVWGILGVLAGFGVLGGATWAILVGIGVAFVNCLGQLSWAATYPVWALSAMVLDVLVIYGLMVYGLGDENREL
jgi:hypothetical protein